MTKMTVPGTVADIRETANRLSDIAIATADPMILLTTSKAAGYLRGVANWLEEADKKAAARAEAEAMARQTEPLNLNDM